MLRRNNCAVRPVHNHDVHNIYTHGEWVDHLIVLCAGKLRINTGVIRFDQTTFQLVKIC